MLLVIAMSIRKPSFPTRNGAEDHGCESKQHQQSVHDGRTGAKREGV